MPCLELRGKLRWSIESRIHLAAQTALRFGHCASDRCKRCVTNHHHVHIALAVGSAVREGSKDERHSNLLSEGRQCGSKHPGCPERLHHQTRQFLVHRAIGISAIKHLPPHFTAREHSDLAQQF
jgi:hypothetical protein